jgi:RNA recognition motif-containing protein
LTPSKVCPFRKGTHFVFCSFQVVRDKDSGESRGFGFVTFANESSAVEAIGARDGSLLDGRKLVVNVSRSWAGSNGEEESGSEGTPSEFSHDRH